MAPAVSRLEMRRKVEATEEADGIERGQHLQLTLIGLIFCCTSSFWRKQRLGRINSVQLFRPTSITKYGNRLWLIMTIVVFNSGRLENSRLTVFDWRFVFSRHERVVLGIVRLRTAVLVAGTTAVLVTGTVLRPRTVVVALSRRDTGAAARRRTEVLPECSRSSELLLSWGTVFPWRPEVRIRRSESRFTLLIFLPRLIEL